MKLTTLMLLVSITAQSQVSIDGGFITRGSLTGGINYEKNFSPEESCIGLYSKAGVSICRDNFYPTSSFQVGIGTNKYPSDPGWLHGNIILSGGLFWHTGIWVDGTKEETLKQKGKMFFGATLEYQHYQRMPLKVSWDGKTTHITLGFIFKSRNE